MRSNKQSSKLRDRPTAGQTGSGRSLAGFEKWYHEHGMYLGVGEGNCRKIYAAAEREIRKSVWQQILQDVNDNRRNLWRVQRVAGDG